MILPVTARSLPGHCPVTARSLPGRTRNQVFPRKCLIQWQLCDCRSCSESSQTLRGDRSVYSRPIKEMFLRFISTQCQSVPGAPWGCHSIRLAPCCPCEASLGVFPGSFCCHSFIKPCSYCNSWVPESQDRSVSAIWSEEERTQDRSPRGRRGRRRK